MIVVTVELWPEGNQSQRERLGEVRITNDQTGGERIGNYDYKLTTFGVGKASGQVKGHPRSRRFWWLLYTVLRQFHPYEE